MPNKGVMAWLSAPKRASARPLTLALRDMNKAPYGYEHRDLPALNRKAWKYAGMGILLTIAAVIGRFALSGNIGPTIRTALAVFFIIVGQYLFWKHFRKSNYCPNCGTRFSNTVKEEYRTILFVCDHCQICWDTGVTQEPTSFSSG